MLVRVEADYQPMLRRWVDFPAFFRRTTDWLAVETPHIALALAALAAPAAGVLYTLALWRIGADLNWTDDFVIATGLFSHWQVWLVLAAGVQSGGKLLERQIVSDLAANKPGRD